MNTFLADCQRERDAFASLLESTCIKRILMFYGDKGTGKTTLLNTCLNNIPSDIKNIHFNGKGTDTPIAEIFSRTGFILGWERFPNFVEQVAELSQSTEVRINKNWFVGINNHIRVALYAESLQNREERRVALTDAWFEDLSTLRKLLLISIDTFEDAPAETAAWINGPFLYRAARTENLRVLIAGCNVPDMRENAGAWGYYCNTYQLPGVQDAEHWFRVVEDMGCEATLDLVKGICLALQGRPADIMNVIYGLPRQAGRL